MVVIPIILTFVLISGAMFIFLGEITPDALVSILPRVPIEQGPALNLDVANVEVPVADAILVYQLASGIHVLILPEQLNNRFAEVNWDESGLFTDVVVVSEDLVAQLTIFEENTVLFQVGITIVVVLFTLLANHLLLKVVFKPIMRSLNIFTEGVHEITIGNLGYRLNHEMGNEFDAVGANFNEMATRLQTMVEQRQIDEKNRKELIAGISHDLRTPLTAIRTYAEGIELEMATTPAVQAKYLTTIKDKTNDIEQIINQLFLFSKLDIGEFPLKLDKYRAGAWLEDFVTTVSDEYQNKGLTVTLGQNVNEAFFLIDSIQLKNVMINLLENSVKYGKIPNSEILVTAQQVNNDIIITLTDNGPGVPNTDLAYLFDVFYRSDKARTNPGQGSGLGLAIAAKMIQRMDGEITAKNAETGGLQMTIKLPVVEGVRLT